MSNIYAVRNLRLCTKDCLCLYVCPTGASDTENSIIDVNKCISCGACAAACPSSAISMVPKNYQPQQPKADNTVQALRILIQSKGQAENIAAALPDSLSVAVEKSSRLMAEDIWREVGFMLPQSGNTKEFLQQIRELFLDGYYKVCAFGSDPCKKCGKCNPDHCNFPDQTIPAMEACGIDVFATVRANGLEINTLRDKGKLKITLDICLQNKQLTIYKGVEHNY